MRRRRGKLEPEEIEPPHFRLQFVWLVVLIVGLMALVLYLSMGD